ncbi:hypothetical protein, partial, partial [Parasitella parasitica]
MWSKAPADWWTVQVVPIFKGKGNSLEPGSYCPISLCSALRKLVELCFYPDFLVIAFTLDPVQSGFCKNRGTLDSALALHEICRQHTADPQNKSPVLCSLDTKQAYNAVHRPVIWHALEVSGALSSIFRPATALLDCRWNPTKYVVLNPPPYTGRTSPLRLYESPLTATDSFVYLGLPFNHKAQLDADLLVQRNVQSALVAMRTCIQPLGFHSPSFSRLTAGKNYTTFIRPE